MRSARINGESFHYKPFCSLQVQVAGSRRAAVHVNSLRLSVREHDFCFIEGCNVPVTVIEIDPDLEAQLTDILRSDTHVCSTIAMIVKRRNAVGSP
jgi:hypothetical protein